MHAGDVLQVHGDTPFMLHWSSDNWQTVNDTKSNRNALQIDYVDLKQVATKGVNSIRFTFLWTEDNRWEGRDYEVTVR
jgi:glucoamylase